MSTGILGTRASLVADVNLILQVIVCIILAIGAMQAKRGKFDVHGGLMSAAIILNAAAIVFIMNPSFFRILPFALRNPGAPRPKVLWPHASIGAMAELLGVYIVIRTQVEPSALSHRPSIKRLMAITLLLWVTALIAGIVLYFVWYV